MGKQYLAIGVAEGCVALWITNQQLYNIGVASLCGCHQGCESILPSRVGIDARFQKATN